MLTKSKTNYHISLADAKMHLRVDTSDEDSLIMNLIQAAVVAAEQYTNRDIALTTNTLVLENFLGYVIDVDECNLISIDSLKDQAGNTLLYGNMQTYDSYFRIYLDNSLPIQIVTMVFKTGYDAGKLNPLIRVAIMSKIKDMYDNRENMSYNNLVDMKRFETMLNPFVAMKVKPINYNVDIHQIR